MNLERGSVSNTGKEQADGGLDLLFQMSSGFSHEGERIGTEDRRYAGELKKFLHRMADPSNEQLESTIRGLFSRKHDEVKELEGSISDVNEDPAGFFGKRRINIEDKEGLTEGACNAVQVVGDVEIKLNLIENGLLEKEDFDLREFSKREHRIIQMQRGEREIGRGVKKIKSENGIDKRYEMGSDLRQKINGYIKRSEFEVRSGMGNQEVEPTWDNLKSIPNLRFEFYPGGDYSITNYSLGKYIDATQAAIERYDLEREMERLPKRDEERFDKLRLKYGAKVANQILLSELAPLVNELGGSGFLSDKLIVPEFEPVPVGVYRKWRNSESVDDDLRGYFEWANELRQFDDCGEPMDEKSDYIIRSSAVFSEDDKGMSAASMYDSVVVKAGSGFKEFKKAAVRVSESVDSPKAIKYRQEHGVSNEEMGLEIQRYVDSNHGEREMEFISKKGTINSKLKGVPYLMEVKTGTSRNFIRRDELDFFLAYNTYGKIDSFKNVHHFPPDIFKTSRFLPIELAKITKVLERVWGGDVQMEFVWDKFGNINGLQVRDLPYSAEIGDEKRVNFLNENPVHIGASVGVGDMTLSVLGNKENNSNKEGLVAFAKNSDWAVGYGEDNMPKEGAVVITDDDGNNGHIQTIAAEKDLICIFPDVNIGDGEGKPTLLYNAFEDLSKVRLISNGIEGRIYDRSDDETLDK